MSSFPSPRPIHHIGVAVHSLDDSAGVFELISGETRSPTQTLESQGVRVTFIGSIELLEPLAPDTTVGRFLERRGQALHHVAFSTPDIEAELARLEAAGARLIDAAPRAGTHGYLVAFIHPASTGGILTELVQAIPTE